MFTLHHIGAFVSTLHGEILGREPEPSGLEEWLDVLAIGVAPASVAQGIFDSAEHRSMRNRGEGPRNGVRVALADALKAEEAAVRIGVAYQSGPGTSIQARPRAYPIPVVDPFETLWRRRIAACTSPKDAVLSSGLHHAKSPGPAYRSFSGIS